MSDLSSKIRDAATRVSVDWTDDRARRVERAMVSRGRRRGIAKAALAATAALAILALVALRFLSPRPPAGTASQGPAELDFEAGTTITKIAPEAVLLPTLVSNDRVDVALDRGGARFDVARKPSRVFRVHVGDVTVEVVGTAFEVERVGAERARVAVTRGRVRVVYGDHSDELGAGESGVFPPVMTAATSSSPSAVASDDAPAASAAPSAVASAPSWRSLAHDGEFDKAYDELTKEGPSAVRDEPAELLLAADVARLSKHAAQAVGPLRRVVEQHPGDPRAPLAAFTLGRVLLDQLGRPREAADMFARARALGGGGLGEDALAREVEAASRAGDADRARRLAEEYVAKYPNGQRKRSVVKFGGLE